MKKFALGLVLTAASLLPFTAAQAQQMTPGNGATGFGGTLGNGSVTLSSTSSTISFTFNPSSGTSIGLNQVILYLSTGATNNASTSSFTDTGDEARRAVSGYYPGNPSNSNTTNRTVATFSSGFTADYAVDFNGSGNNSNGYVNLFDLSNTNTFNAVGGSGNGPYTLTVDDSVLHITSGSSVKYVATLISSSVYRSNETVGSSTTTPDPAGGGVNAGFNGSTTFSNYNTYITGSDAMPEPGDLALLTLGIGVLGVAVRRRAVKS